MQPHHHDQYTWDGVDCEHDAAVCREEGMSRCKGNGGRKGRWITRWGHITGGMTSGFHNCILKLLWSSRCLYTYHVSLCISLGYYPSQLWVFTMPLQPFHTDPIYILLYKVDWHTSPHRLLFQYYKWQRFPPASWQICMILVIVWWIQCSR